jgi:D-alanyl-D-alanine dipeptidase
MFTPQFAKPDEKTGFGIGFMVGELDGRQRIGHGGAIYGFATELAALPEEKLGVVVITSKDVANGLTTRIADVALRQLLAVRQGKPLPPIEETMPLRPETARRLAGHYRSGAKALDLVERGGRLHGVAARGGFRVELRALGDALMVDDVLAYGPKIEPEGDKLHIGKDLYERVPVERPAPPPARWLGLIGEYGWDHNTLYVLEKDGKLHALIEWFFLYPLEEVSENVYRFPDFGLYHGEKLVFRRDGPGRATAVEAAGVVFRRRPGPADGETFRIRPQRPITELRREALAARPPAEKGDFRKSDLGEVTALDDTIKLDIRYATDNNFLGTPLYTSAHAYMQRPAAEALVRIHRKLAEQGYGLLIYDAYRPWHVTKMFWEATPEKDRLFVADPMQGSRHNRGCAVDLTLYDRKTGKPVPMVSGYDEFSDRAYPEYLGGTALQRWHRDLLRRAMEEAFSVYDAEWWHFDYKDWRKYPIGNRTFEAIAAGKEDVPAAKEVGHLTVPARLIPDQGKVLLLLRAEGVQIYKGVEKDGKLGWALEEPRADLLEYDTGEPVGTHSKGPVWAGTDGSKVRGKLLASEPAPNRTAIPWLLLEGKGDGGEGRFGKVTFIARVDTWAGRAPLDPPDKAGALKEVRYQATYVFYGPVSGSRLLPQPEK